MARINAGGAPKGRSGAGTYSSTNPQREGTAYMLVVASNDELGAFCDLMFSQIEAGLEAQGGTTPLEAVHLRKYVATAIKARIEHVTKQDYRRLGYEYTGLNVNEGWALPVPVHDLLSSLGVVRINGNEIVYKPVWAPEANDLVLEKEERDWVTRHLKSATTALGIQTLPDMSRDMEGRHSVMVLTNIPSIGEWWFDNPISREDAHSSMMLGITPITTPTRGQGGAEYSVVDTSALALALGAMPIWIPEYRMERRVITRFISEAAKLAV